METLKTLCAKYKTSDFPDKDTTHSYIDVYQEVLDIYRTRAKNILEIGLMSGESLRMWEEYFDGKVWGMDCSETPINGLADLRPMIAEGGHNIIIGDATSQVDIEKHFGAVLFDVIIDDASHEINAQLKTYSIFKNYLAPNAIYIIEDIQDIDATADLFNKLDDQKDIIILDRRSIKGRYDDVLVMIKNKLD